MQKTIDEMRESTIHRVIGPTILLGSGTYFDFESPETSEITIEDIAWGLAFEARWAGQCRSRVTRKRLMYTVAQHCVIGSYRVEPEFAYDALMHEAEESVCGDMTGPLKSLCPDYKSVAKRVQGALFNRFGVSMTDPARIKQLDLRLWATERRDLLPWKGEAWSAEVAAEPFHDMAILPWSPESAAEAFLRRFEQLKPSGLPDGIYESPRP